MILIDTSAWIEFFRKSGEKFIKLEVATYLDLDEAAYTCPIYFELLAGAKENEIGLIDETLSFCERQIFKSNYWEKTAKLERSLRQKGITIPRDDLFVATVALEVNMAILCKDRHFDIIQNEEGSLKVEQLA